MVDNNIKKLGAVLLLVASFFTQSAFGQSISSNLSFSLKSGNVFPVDNNSCGVAAPTAYFVAVEAYNSGSTEINVGQLQLDSVPTGWSILGPLNGKYPIGKLAAGQKKTAYFYAHANCADKGTTKGIRFTADNGSATQKYRPALNVVGILTTASAGSMQSRVSSLRVLGAYIMDTVTFSYQGFPTGGEMLFSPSTLVSFKSSLLKLEKVQVVSAASGIGVTAGNEDLLYFNAGFTGSGSTNYDISVLFKWKVVGLGDSTLLVPLSANQQGGSNVKGKVGDSLTNLTSTPIILAKWLNIPTSANTISISKTVNKSSYAAGDTLTFDIALTNSSSSADVMVDRIVDTLPTGLTFVDIASASDYQVADFSSLPSLGATGNLLFEGGNTNPSNGNISLFVPANTTKKLKLRFKVASGTTGTLVNKSAAYISTTRCDTGYATLYEYGPPVASLKSKTNVKCNGGTDGTFEIKVVNGQPTYRYSIYGGSPYQYSPVFSNLPAANYVVTITDSAGQSDTVHVSITEPSALTLSIGSKTNVTCNGLSDGTVTLSAIGGTSPYSYKAGTGTYQSSASFINVDPGTTIYTVQDINGCLDTQYVLITQPSVLDLTLAGINVTCNGLSDGSISITGTGGTTPYQYNLNGGTYQSSNSFTGLSAGTYTVSIKDINGCTTSKSVVITQPNALTVSSTAKTNVDCKGNATGSITVAGAGGTTPYSFNIGGGTYSTNNVFTGLIAGSYTIGIKDANGCTNTVNVSITEPATLNLSATVTRPVCYADKTGAIALNVTGGTSAYSYRMDSTWQTPTSTYVSSNTFNALYEGKYAAQVKDANGCLDTVQVTISHLDLIKPIPVPHKILTVYLGALGTVFVSANMSDSASTDNCAIASRSITQTAFNCSHVGYNTVNFKVVDINGNRDSIDYIVNVLDTTRPNLNTRNFTLYLDNSGLASLAIDSVDLGTTDQCDSIVRTISQTLFDCQNSGYNNTINKVVFTATDVNGNVATDTLIITVLDTIKPTLVLKNVSLYLNASGTATLTTADFDNGSYDNCNIDSLIMSDSTFDCSQTGVNVITITAVDPSKNRSTSTINVTVYDTIKPTLQVKNHTVYLDTTGKGSMTKMSVVAILYDNCGIDTLDVSQLNWTVADTGVNEVYVWTQDASGNKVGPDTALVTVIAKDTDGDGIPDFVEGSKDTDGDGVFDYADMDSDNDGLLDFVENENQDTALDLDGDGIPNYKDLDSDNDGIFDVYEVDGLDPDNDGVSGTSPVAVNSAGVPTTANGGMGYNEVDTDGDGLPDYKDLDTDGDGIADKTEGVADPDADGIGNWRDTDSDGDGINDNIEGTVDTDGDGIADFLDTDSDNDGISDKIEGTTDTDGDGTGDWRDLDSDNDGINDQTEGTLDTDSDGTVDRLDLDSDNDGIPDSVEGSVDSDGDGRGNWRDLDSDDDGIQDSFEAGSNPATPVDTDSDGKPDYLDTDSDADGILDNIEDVVDTDGDGISDFRDGDSDGDGISDLIEGTVDTDGDGTGDWRDLDSDGDGISDKIEGNVDSDGDGTGDWRDLDSDGDGITDKIEGTVDTDGDGKPDYLDLDSDGDGISDNIEGTTDTDGDGTGDWRDLDSDNDGISDQIEGTVDTDSDGTGDWRDLDSDNDGISDQTEGTVDTDGDGTGDWRDIDSDGDNILDSTEGTVDTDGDGKGDWRDTDSDNDGILDSTEGTNDFDGDGIGNWRDLDSDGDGINDQTEGTGDKDGDLQGNWLDLDSDGDGISDQIEGTTDTDGDGVADYLDLDSDGDGISDQIEGTTDTDGDGKGDWRDLDSDNDGISDQIEGTTDTDGDGVGNWRDADSDGDGISDQIEGTTDTDSDGLPDYLDLDSDNDGINDKVEGSVDTDGDGVGDWRDTDSDNDELLDGDVTEGTGDSDKDGIPNYIDPDYFIPEGISPNNDGVNDVLYIRGLKAKVFSQATMLVFNRWGQLVYESASPYKNDWAGTGINGDILPEGVYYVVFKYGSTTVNKNIYIKN
jgi:gliding motility-associated-like protein/uncharacterized repeat protein (TIGR01451 family)